MITCTNAPMYAVEREHLEKLEYHPWSHLRIRNKVCSPYVSLPVSQPSFSLPLFHTPFLHSLPPSLLPSLPSPFPGGMETSLSCTTQRPTQFLPRKSHQRKLRKRNVWSVQLTAHTHTRMECDHPFCHTW